MHDTRIGVLMAQKNLNQRGLADAVSADERDPASTLEFKGDVGKQRPIAMRFRKTARRKHHGEGSGLVWLAVSGTLR